MKIFAIISEYNPLHSGHLYHIEQTCKIADKLIVIMSGSFTQRGDSAIDNKYCRAANAIKAGADMVIELPTLYAISPADKFAYGAIKTLSLLNVNHLSFGSESGNIDELYSLIDILDNETDDIKSNIRKELNQGKPLVVAQANAINNLGIGIELKPNNILGLEYIKAIRELNANITPYTIKRSGNDYNSLSTKGEHLSATAIRAAIIAGDYNAVNEYLPYGTNYNLNSNDNLGKLILYKLNTMSNEELEQIFDISEGLHNRIIKCLNCSLSYNEFISNLKTRRYTMARLKRILIAALLGISKDKYRRLLNSEHYINVLAINEDSKDLLSSISTSNVITKPSDFKRINDNSKEMIELDTLAHRILTIINEDCSNLNSMQVITR